MTHQTSLAKSIKGATTTTSTTSTTSTNRSHLGRSQEQFRVSASSGNVETQLCRPHPAPAVPGFWFSCCGTFICLYLLATVSGSTGPLHCTVSFLKFSLSEFPALPKTHTPPATENREPALLHCVVIRVSEEEKKPRPSISSPTSPQQLSQTDLT